MFSSTYRTASPRSHNFKERSPLTLSSGAALFQGPGDNLNNLMASPEWL
jgi:hypothetical protein